MLLSEMIAEEDLEFARNVKVDVESFTPPPGLTSVAFSYFEKDGVIDVVLLDVIISYSLAGVEVILELPFEHRGKIDDVLSLASNLSIDLSILPPSEWSDGAMDEYKQILNNATRYFFSNVNSSKMIWPVSSYLEYLTVEAMTEGECNYRATDPYIIDTFVSAMTEAQANEMKESLREEVYKIHGGEDAFVCYLNTIAAGLYQRVEDNIIDLGRGSEAHH